MPRPGFSFVSHFATNRLLVIDALGPEDSNAASNLEADVAIMATNVGLAGYTRYVKVDTPHALLGVLTDLAEECLVGIKPIVHIEAHGDKVRGLQVGLSKEFLNWHALHEAFVMLNRNSRGNLGVVMSACHGLHAIRPITIDDPSPYYFLLGPDVEVKAGFLETQTRAFYGALLTEGNLTAAEARLDPRIRLFQSTLMFATAFARYLKDACIGKNAAARMERLLSEAIAGGIEPSVENLRSIRGAIKARLRAQDESFTRIGTNFLHGPIPFTYAELLQFVRAGLPTR
jgi:hypothetical protein